MRYLNFVQLIHLPSYVVSANSPHCFKSRLAYWSDKSDQETVCDFRAEIQVSQREVTVNTT